MGTFLLVLALVLIVVAIPAAKLFGSGRWRRLIAAGLIAVGIAVIVGDCVTIVPPRHEGIEIAYGKTVSNLPAGPHLVRPWSSVDSSWDATFQTLKYDGGSGDKKPLTVRLKNQTTATVNVTVQWRLRPGVRCERRSPGISSNGPEGRVPRE